MAAPTQTRLTGSRPTKRPARKARRRRKPRQLSLPAPRTWGGRRDGAGRPTSPNSGVSHVRRPALSARHPVHVSWTLLPAVGNLRRRKTMAVLFAALGKGAERPGFRVVEFSAQKSHLHLVCEADDERALARGLQGLGIRIARGLNGRLGRKGRVFADRYFARALTTPREVRAALAYVLNNSRRHARKPLARGWLDPCSSAPLFGGWRGYEADQVIDVFVAVSATVNQGLCATRRAGPQLRVRDPGGAVCIVASPQTWLLKGGWKRGGGELVIDAVPGPVK
jgi:hypothetical protein